MNEQYENMCPNVIKRSYAAGSVEHTWIPPLHGGDDRVSVSAPSGICLTFSSHAGCLVRIGGKTMRRDVEGGCVQVAGPEPIDWLVVREPSDVVEVIASPEVRRAIAEEMRVSHAADLSDLHGGTDCVVWAIAARVRTALRGSDEVESLECDRLIRHLYRHVLATRFGGRLPAKGNGKLDKRRVDRVIGYIEAHLTDRCLSIAVLSEIASLSPFHFLRCFERTLHMTPHQFVRARRLERIRDALSLAGELAEIAQRYGFAHLRHFRAAYSRHHGLAPGEELAEVLRRSSELHA